MEIIKLVFKRNEYTKKMKDYKIIYCICITKPHFGYIFDFLERLAFHKSWNETKTRTLDKESKRIIKLAITYSLTIIYSFTNTFIYLSKSNLLYMSPHASESVKIPQRVVGHGQ